MLISLRFIALSLLIFLVSICASAQTAVAPPPETVRSAIEQLPIEQRNVVRSAIRATQPFVVFLPGIPETQTNVHPLKTIALFCGIGFAASLCMASFGLDISVGFF